MKAKAVWIQNIKILVSDYSQTIVDILDDPSIGGGMRTAVDIVQEYFKSQYRDDDAIVKYIDRKNNRTVFRLKQRAHLIVNGICGSM